MSDGTKVFATKVSGKITMNEALLTTSGAAHQQADHGHHPGDRVGEQQQQHEARRSASRTDVRIRQPTTSPVSDMTTITMTLLTTSAAVRPTSTADARHRQRPEPVDDALLQVLGQAGAGDRRAEDDRLGEDPGDQELPVVRTPGTG